MRTVYRTSSRLEGGSGFCTRGRRILERAAALHLVRRAAGLVDACLHEQPAVALDGGWRQQSTCGLQFGDLSCARGPEGGSSVILRLSAPAAARERAAHLFAE